MRTVIYHWLRTPEIFQYRYFNNNSSLMQTQTPLRMMAQAPSTNALFDPNTRYSNMNSGMTATGLMDKLECLNAPFNQKQWERSKSDNNPALPRWPTKLMPP